MSPRSVDEYEHKAQEAEQSSLPTFLKIGQVIVWIVYALAVASAVILCVAFLFRLLGAGTEAAFTRWVYRNSEFAMRPFRGIFPVREIGDDSVLDISLLFGAVMYVLVALATDALFYNLRKRLTREEKQTAELRAQADALRLQFDQQQYAQQQYDLQQAAQRQAAQQAVAPLAAPAWQAPQPPPPPFGTPGSTP